MESSNPRIPPEPPKETAPETPKITEAFLYRAALEGVRSQMAANPHRPSSPPSSRDIVRWFMSSLSPQCKAKPPSLSRDLESLGRAVRAIITAADEDVISEDEAQAVIAFISECFASRRLDDVVNRVTTPRSGKWFLLRSELAAEAEAEV